MGEFDPIAITPPPELVQRLRAESPHGIRDAGITREVWLVNHAYAAGADQELEACCADIHTVHGQHRADWLRSMRRPKLPSLKEQALAALWQVGSCEGIDNDTFETLHRALEALPND